MTPLVAKFEKYITYTLIVVGMLFVIYQLLDLVYEFVKLIRLSIGERKFIIHQEGTPIAVLFFGILLMLEIIETLKVFSHDHVIKIRIILLVGLIAVTRKILMMDMTHADPAAELAVAGLVIALASGYFLVSRAVSPRPGKNEPDQGSNS